MSIEPIRGCGFRKVGGLYLVGPSAGYVCDRLPIPLTVCPCCGEGIKFSRGWTWIEPFELFDGNHFSQPIRDMEDKIIDWIKINCNCKSFCPVCYPSFFFIHIETDERLKAGLLWVGEKHYSPESFTKEANDLGISKRIAAIPRGFKFGETWVFLAHKKAIAKYGFISDQGPLFNEDPNKVEYQAGIFQAFKPKAIQRIVKQSEFDLYQSVIDDLKYTTRDEWNDILKLKLTGFQSEIFNRLKSDVDRGVQLVPVPDDDPDHNPS